MAEIPTVQRQIMPQAEQGLRLDPGAASRQFDIDLTRSNDGIARGLQNLSQGVLQLAELREQVDITACQWVQ